MGKALPAHGLQGGIQNGSGGCIEVDPFPAEIVQTQGIVPFDKIEVVLSVQDRKGKGAVNSLRHFLQAPKVQPLFLLDQLHGNVAVGFDFGFREIFRQAKLVVIGENAVVRQGESVLWKDSREGMGCFFYGRRFPGWSFWCVP